MRSWLKSLGNSVAITFEQGWYLFRLDFIQRYRLTFFGYWWSVVRPLAAALPLIFIGHQFEFGSDSSVPYVAYSLTGVTLWNLFWSCVTLPLFYARRFRKVLLEAPVREASILVASGIGAMFNFALTIPVVLFVAHRLGVTLQPHIWLAVPCLPILILAGFSVTLPFVVMAYVYHDVLHGVGFLGQFLMWTVPVIYVMPAQGTLRLINLYNPLTYLLATPRDLILLGHTSEPLAFLAAASGFLVVFAASMLFYRRSVWLALDHVI